MTSTIFCPSNHLILDAPRCPQCGWARPPAVDSGKPVWGPLDLGAGLGGPGTSVFAAPGSAQGVAVFPLRSGELAGVNLNDGSLRWRVTLEVGLMARELVPDRQAGMPGADRLLISLSDERSIEHAGPGLLASLDPHSGELTTLWQPGAHQFSPPSIAEELIVLRSSASELVALRRSAQLEIAWVQPLQAWWSLPPAICGEMALVADGRAMYGEGWLLAFQLKDGKPAWKQPTQGLLSQAPVLSQGVVVCLDKHNHLIALDSRTGQSRWQRDYPKVYSNLQAGEEHVYVIVRGAARSGETGHYLLQALDPVSNELAWETPLPVRARIMRLLDGQNLYMSSDDGRLLAYSAANGDLLWEYSLGSKEDPIQTEPVMANGFLLAGTYAGRVVALQVRPAETSGDDPEQSLAAGEWSIAADAFALRGEYGRAAEIYSSKLNQLDKAFSLYEHGSLFREAGELAKARGLYEKALDYFDRSQDTLAQADTLLASGNELAAAQKFAQAGDFHKAAELFEQGKNLPKALDYYYKANDREAVLRLRPTVPPDQKLMAILEDWGFFLEAGEIAMLLGALEKAILYFQKAGDIEREWSALEQLVKADPEPWTLERLAALARGKGRFRQEAEALSKLDRTQEAAEAYHKAARQAQVVSPNQENDIAELYRLAADCYGEAGLEQEELVCRSQVVYYRHLPQIHVTGKTRKAFREEEFNTLELIIQNVGRGIAREICVRVDAQRFEIDPATCLVNIRSLAPEKEKHADIYLRPKKDQIGETVPLLLDWSWLDHEGNDYERHTISLVEVKRLGDTSPLGTPVVIHAQTYVQGTLIGGDQIAGDVVQGDQIQEGGQKGDRVEIQRGEGVRLHPPSPDLAQTTVQYCPNCSLPVEPDAKFCDGCGAELPRKSGRRKN